jgi:hypothetical protein
MSDRSKRARELLDESYRQIAVLEQTLKELVPEAELRDELDDAFEHYRKCHHKLRATVFVVMTTDD